jgi:hypothetical protein
MIMFIIITMANTNKEGISMCMEMWGGGHPKFPPKMESFQQFHWGLSKFLNPDQQSTTIQSVWAFRGHHKEIIPRKLHPNEDGGI